ncbi:MAG: tRNA glutamyl-Q(34) synthetase GluQRS [Kiritimatiellae bacterium]|nr:tRNA glutamyl-Q(34) synthetase GluQRS [Kiritimatiellia bacterium]
MNYTGRLAPSPTGALHLGNVRTFMVAWLRARSQGGRVIMRMEDLDHPRDKPDAAQAALDDLRWLGFDWDEEFTQSERRAYYRECLQELIGKGLAYPCTCSRKDVESAQSAPHEGEQLYYPGTCRGRWKTWSDAAAAIAPRIPCWRFAASSLGDAAKVWFDDAIFGRYAQDVAKTLGDFPLARDEDGAGYTLAALADDVAMGVSEVVRGADLLAATPAQILVARALGCEPPRYCHVPLVVGADGKRLAKRHGDSRIASFRAAGIPAESIIGRLAHSCGWGDGAPCTLAALVEHFDIATIPREPLRVAEFDCARGEFLL